MQYLHQLRSGLDITPLALQLRRNPQLWNQHRERTADTKTPHRDCDDIWVRYAPDKSLANQPHHSVWYDAYASLPAVADLVFPLAFYLKAEAIGGILITRIPAGKAVHPHNDFGWHATYYDKVAIQIAAHPQQAFCYKDDAFISAPGDAYWFNNQETHWVTNDSPVERITMIVCLKLQSPQQPQL